MQVNFKEEKKLWKNGYEFVVGLDESGRGPLAGPVVAAAVCVDLRFKIYPVKYRKAVISPKAKLFNGVNDLRFKIKDSKKLNARQRDYFYDILTNQENIKWGVGMVSEKIIDKINILEATKLAMKKAIDDLYRKSHGRENQSIKHFFLIDGNFHLNNMKVPQKSIIRGDEKVFSIAAAGIIAKVQRDKIMKKFHKKYPEYGFDRHKGYG
ncbi:MAG: ribonuclease HII, partial [Patescibacteria group bacterium]